MYLNLEQLSTSPLNNLQGIDSLEYILYGLESDVRSVEEIEIFEVSLTWSEKQRRNGIRERAQYEEDPMHLLSNPSIFAPAQASGYSSPRATRLEAIEDRKFTYRLLNRRIPTLVV